MTTPLGAALLRHAAQERGNVAVFTAKPITPATDAKLDTNCQGKRNLPSEDATSDTPERPSKQTRLGEGPMTFKFLAPEGLSNALEAFVPVIADVLEGSLRISDETDLYPGTGCRIVTISSHVEKGVLLGMLRILSIVSQCRACISNTGELRLTVVMPAKSISMLIGVRGTNIHMLQKSSGAHVHVEGEALGFSRGRGPSFDKLVHSTGTQQAQENVIARLIECVEEFMDQPWFPKWASRTNIERVENEMCDTKTCNIDEFGKGDGIVLKNSAENCAVGGWPLMGGMGNVTGSCVGNRNAPLMCGMGSMGMGSMGMGMGGMMMMMPMMMMPMAGVNGTMGMGIMPMNQMNGMLGMPGMLGLPSRPSCSASDEMQQKRNMPISSPIGSCDLVASDTGAQQVFPQASTTDLGVQAQGLPALVLSTNEKIENQAAEIQRLQSLLDDRVSGHLSGSLRDVGAVGATPNSTDGTLSGVKESGDALVAGW